MKVIHAKSKGKEVHVPEPGRRRAAGLMDALMASLERHRSGGKSSNGAQAAHVEAERRR